MAHIHSASSTTRAVGISVVVSVVVGLLIAWFAWPAKELAPRDLPVVVAGPPAATTVLADRLATARPGAFEVTAVPDAAAADAALRDRTAYAAFIVGPTGLALHTASGASPTVAQLLTAAAAELPGAGGPGAGPSVTVVDVAPGSAGDPRGAGFASGFLPLILAGMLSGILFALLLTGLGPRLLGLGLVSLFVGAVGAGVLTWLDVIQGHYFAAAGVVALLTLAVSGAVAGLGAALGRPGIGLGVLLVFLLGNPISAVAAAPELLPQPWGEIGQLLPPGAGATLLRSAVFFDGAGSAAPLWTLLAWAAAGLTLVVVAGSRRTLVLRATDSRPAADQAELATR